MNTQLRATTVYTLRVAAKNDSTREVNELTARLYNATMQALTDPARIQDSHGSTSGWDFAPDLGPEWVLPYGSVSFRLPTDDEGALEFAAKVRRLLPDDGAWTLTTGLGIHQRRVSW